MRQASFFWRLYFGYVALILLLAVLVGVLVDRRFTTALYDQVEHSLRRDAVLLRELARPDLRLGLDPGGELQPRLRSLHPTLDSRLTVIRADGQVVADTDHDPAVMANHADRPELQLAAAQGEGNARRFSRTLQLRMMYHAVALRDGEQLIGYARSALPVETIEAQIVRARWNVVLAAGIAALVALVGGFVFARRITSPIRAMTVAATSIARGDYDQRLYAPSTDEVGELARAFNQMTANLRRHLAEVEGSRNKILAILASMKEGVIAVDGQEKVVHLNRAAAEMVDIDFAAAVGRPVWELVRISEITDALSRTIRLSQSLDGELRLPGVLSDRVLELQTSVLHDSTGEAAGAVLVLHDASELRRLQGVRQDFVSNVSHEMKTPVAAIRGLVESILDDDDMDAEVREQFLSRVGQQCVRLNTLVTDLLSLAAAEEKLAVEDGEPMDLRGPLRDSVLAHTPALEEKNLTVATELPDSSLAVRADAETLRQVFDNLVSNAIRYTPSGGRLWVRARADGTTAVVEVQDTGIGIEPQHRKRVFERFYRADKARSRQLGGTGLGLAIVKHLVLALGGEISVDSTPAVGSTFTVRLPIHSRS